jgi:hypothetical protein
MPMFSPPQIGQQQGGGDIEGVRNAITQALMNVSQPQPRVNMPPGMAGGGGPGGAPPPNMLGGDAPPPGSQIPPPSAPGAPPAPGGMPPGGAMGMPPPGAAPPGMPGAMGSPVMSQQMAVRNAMQAGLGGGNRAAPPGLSPDIMNRFAGSMPPQGY